MELEKVTLSRDKARSLTDEVKDDAGRLWRKLVELYEGQAHIALGYSSWGTYFKNEFERSERWGYNLLDAGRVARELESVNHGSLRAPNARQARELAPLKDNPEALKEVWAEVVETHEVPTAANVREIVQRKIGPMSHKAELNANAAKQRLDRTIVAVGSYCDGIEAILNVDRALLVADHEEVNSWINTITTSISALSQLRRSLKETMGSGAQA